MWVFGLWAHSVVCPYSLHFSAPLSSFQKLFWTQDAMGLWIRVKQTHLWIKLWSRKTCHMRLGTFKKRKERMKKTQSSGWMIDDVFFFFNVTSFITEVLQICPLPRNVLILISWSNLILIKGTHWPSLLTSLTLFKLNSPSANYVDWFFFIFDAES